MNQKECHRTNDIGSKVSAPLGAHSGVNGFKINYCIMIMKILKEITS
jgi:hypothetical protein